MPQPSSAPVPTNPLRALRLDQLRRRTSEKWRHYPPDVLPLWVAEMDVPLAEPVARAVTDAIALGDTGYASGTGYAEALAGFAAARWDWTIDIDHTALVPDVMLGVVEVLKLITDAGDAVVVNPPVYPPFFAFVEHLDRQVVAAPLTPAGRLDPAALETAFRSATNGGRRAAAYLLCSPQNPTGVVHSRDELAAVAELAARYGVRVVADEIHAPLVHPGARFVPYLTVPGGDTGFALLSASKAWNLAGLKSAVAVAGAAAGKDLARMPDEAADGASHVGVLAHTAALTDGVGWLDALLSGLDENRRLLAELLAERLPEVGYRPPAGTYFAWLDCRPLGLGDDPAAVFLDRGRVAVNPGSDFGTGGAGYVRLNLATTPEILADAVDRIAASVLR
ncbi:MalY/PatB family protein [Plantactinospora sp. GCM10030261]|uniref:MalY/PatB family protein n=1 Tax=Plantactinospora sp. GCM10030261 TaxID=3273420 RepID=UPI00360C4342